MEKRAFFLSMRMPVYVGLFIAIIVIALHGLASIFGWYWIFRWFDTPMHVLGGLFAGYLGIIIYVMTTMKKRSPLWPALLASLIVGIAWEFLEYAYGLSGLDPIHRFDAIKDLLNDMMGGVISLLVWDLFIHKKLNK
jgi:hypothetical protein